MEFTDKDAFPFLKVEANVHYPTDYNLLWDSARKCMDVLGHLMEDYLFTARSLSGKMPKSK